MSECSPISKTLTIDLWLRIDRLSMSVMSDEGGYTFEKATRLLSYQDGVVAMYNSETGDVVLFTVVYSIKKTSSINQILRNCKRAMEAFGLSHSATYGSSHVPGCKVWAFTTPGATVPVDQIPDDFKAE